ncbi:hypothetical protein JTB14_025397 [Gonioctena quinquepunctata]|nr:hypothetical protein JTB14_025397 [Gonioctena quinquepunctata]
MNADGVMACGDPTDEFVIRTININSLKNKRLAVKKLLITHNIQILGTVDTQLKHIPNFSGYSVVNKNKTQLSKGIRILIRNGIPHQKHDLPPAFDGENITFISYYNHPQTIIPADFIEYFSSLNKAILMGDFDARHRQFGDITENRNGIILSNLLLDLPILRTRNFMPTFLNHCGISVIDHILCTERCTSMMDDECFIGATVTSDHMPLLLQTKLRKSIQAFPTTKTFEDYKRTDIELFHANINDKTNEHPFSPLNSIQNINDTVTTIKFFISEAAETATPTSTIILNQQTLSKNIVEKIKNQKKIISTVHKHTRPCAKNRVESIKRTNKITNKTTPRSRMD